MSEQFERVTAAIKAEIGRQVGAGPPDWAATEFSGVLDINPIGRAAIAALTLPDYGPARPMSTAPRDGTRILVLAEVASDYRENAINGPVIVRWDQSAIRPDWYLSPWDSFTRLDGEPTGWFPLPTEQR